jgi:hypothetical protein
MGEMRNACKILVGKPGGKRPLESTRMVIRRPVNVDLMEIRLAGIDWIHLAQDRDRWRTLVYVVRNLRVP